MTITIHVEEEILGNVVDFLNWETAKDYEKEGAIIRGKWHLRPVEGSIEVAVTYDQYIMLADNE
jgi:hypothetical protein